MPLKQRDVDTLRRLAERKAQIAALPDQQRHASLWRRVNSRERVKPPILIYQVPWHEMNADGELTLTIRDRFFREVECDLRRTLYQWRHMPGDMVVEPEIVCPLAITDTGFGIDEKVDVAKTDEENPVVSRHFRVQIRTMKDVDKIKTPNVGVKRVLSERRRHEMQQVFGDILAVRQQGATHFWFAPWDYLIRWYGIQEMMVDLTLRPELVHAAVDRLTLACLKQLDQYEELGLLSLNNGAQIVGSGGLGFTDELPAPGFDSRHVRTSDCWGNAAAQIFSDISPRMHEEFALRYERRWLDRFGLTYYGCCDPLHHKVAMLRSVPNLRKISMSPWADVAKGAEQIGREYVFSYKPNPAILAPETWNPDEARRALRDVLIQTRGCAVEVVLKDISTVHYEPQRLWQWAQIAKEETERCA